MRFSHWVFVTQVMLEVFSPQGFFALVRRALLSVMLGEYVTACAPSSCYGCYRVPQRCLKHRVDFRSGTQVVFELWGRVILR